MPATIQITALPLHQEPHRDCINDSEKALRCNCWLLLVRAAAFLACAAAGLKWQCHGVHQDDRSAWSSVIITQQGTVQVNLREGDMAWPDLLQLGEQEGPIAPYVADADDISNVLFSSGTTGAQPPALSSLPNPIDEHAVRILAAYGRQLYKAAGSCNGTQPGPLPSECH